MRRAQHQKNELWREQRESGSRTNGQKIHLWWTPAGTREDQDPAQSRIESPRDQAKDLLKTKATKARRQSHPAYPSSAKGTAVGSTPATQLQQRHSAPTGAQQPHAHNLRAKTGPMPPPDQCRHLLP